MTEVFYAVLKASFQGSIVILAVMALRLVLKKAPKSLFCLLWLLAGLRLALPFEIQSSLSLQPQLEETQLSIQADQPVHIPDVATPSPEEQPEDTPAVPDQMPTLPQENWENVESDSLLYGEEDGAIAPLTFGEIAAPIWLLGTGIMLAASAISYFRLKRRVRESYLIENGCFECPGLETAFVLGFLPPQIYLPAGLTDQEKVFIFDHENTHIARHDHWYKLLGYLILSVHWFNPLVWVGYSLLCRDIELACDEHVVRNMSLKERKAYSAALLSCGSHTARIAACPVAFGESNPKKRILNVLNYKRPTFWISLLAVIAVIFVAVCLLTSPEAGEEAPEERLWNLEMEVTDVSPSGLTVEFVQSGPFEGYDRAELQYGSEYSLEKWTGDSWEPVEMLPQENPVGWTTEAYLINRDGTTTQRVDWEWLYGEIPAGHYRIGKGVTLDYTLDDNENQTFYAEFEIGTEDPQLQQCLDALADIQSRDAVHTLEQYSFSGDDLPENGVDRNYFRSGETWMRIDQYSGGKFAGNFSLNGSFYESVSPDENFTWKQVDAKEDMFPQPWLLTFDLSAADAEVISRQETGDGYSLRLMVRESIDMGWFSAEEYYADFCFDRDDQFLRAEVHIAADYSEMTAVMAAPDLGEESVISTLRRYAGNLELPEDTAKKDAYQAQVDQCREAMTELKNSEDLYLYVSTLEDPCAAANVYMRGENGWLFQYRRPLWDHESVSWLRIGNEQYIYGGDMDEDGQMTAPYYWQVETRPESHTFQLPYPFDLDWENITLTYGGTVEENGTQAITVLFPDYLNEFVFYFDDGELLYFNVGDTSGEPEATTTQFLVVFPYDGTVAERLDQIYEEAMAALGQKPEKPGAAFYEELFGRETDGAYTTRWIYDLYMTFYLDPEGFVAHLSGHDRAEEILSSMEYEVNYYAPYRFDQVISRLELSGDSHMDIIGRMKLFTSHEVQTQQEEDNLADQTAWLSKCADALESYRARGSWAVSTVNSFSGRDAMNSSSTSVWYGCGDDFLTWGQIPHDGGTGTWWDLQVNGEAYHRYSYTPLEGSEVWADESENEAWDSGWEPGSTNAQEITPPWPLWYDWVGGDITFLEAGTHEGTEYVLFRVSGCPYPSADGKIQEYEVTFLFRDAGRIDSIRVCYSEWGADKQADRYYYLLDSPETDIRAAIDQAYQEAAE